MTTTVRHPPFARLFVRTAAKAEAAGATEHRCELIQGLTGRVLELGAGHGLNFAHYPSEVSEVVAVELRRVLRPGGHIRFDEHVAANTTGLSRLQRATDLIWPHVAGGCHTHRDTVSAIRRAGLEIQTCRRFPFRPCLAALPVTPHVIGCALSVIEQQAKGKSAEW